MTLKKSKVIKCHALFFNVMGMIIKTLSCLVVFAGGIALLAFAIKWEVEYKRGFDGQTAAKIVSYTPVPGTNTLCDISYGYTVDGRELVGVSRRDCLITMITKASVKYKTSRHQCSRLVGGTSAANTGYADLTSCDTTKERIKRQVALVFGILIPCLAITMLVAFWIYRPKKVNNYAGENKVSPNP